MENYKFKNKKEIVKNKKEIAFFVLSSSLLFVGENALADLVMPLLYEMLYEAGSLFRNAFLN